MNTMRNIIQFSLQKLGRDKVPEVFTQKGISFSYQILSENDLIKALKDKLSEEAQEACAAETRQELEEELADLQEVMAVLIQKANLCEKRIAQYRAQKSEKFGSLLRGVFLEDIQIPEDHPDTAHYRKNPEKYPETRLETRKGDIRRAS